MHLDRDRSDAARRRAAVEDRAPIDCGETVVRVQLATVAALGADPAQDGASERTDSAAKD